MTNQNSKIGFSSIAGYLASTTNRTSVIKKYYF